MQARAVAKVERIVAAARQLLEHEGPNAFNTNRIAREAKVGVGSLYEYFPNKQAIIGELIDRLAEGEGDAVLALLADHADQPLEALIEPAVALVCRLYRQNHALYRVLWAMTSRVREVGSRPAERAIVAEMARRLAPRAAELGIADVDLASFTAFHMVESLAARMAEQGDAWSVEQQQLEISRAVLRYLGLSETNQG